MVLALGMLVHIGFAVGFVTGKRPATWAGRFVLSVGTNYAPAGTGSAPP